MPRTYWAKVPPRWRYRRDARRHRADFTPLLKMAAGSARQLGFFWAEQVHALAHVRFFSRHGKAGRQRRRQNTYCTDIYADIPRRRRAIGMYRRRRFRRQSPWKSWIFAAR